MSTPFDSVEAAMMVLSNPDDSAWGEAFAFLIRHPDTSQLMMENFRDTLEQMGVEPSGQDPVTGEPSYSLQDVARAMGIPPDELDIPLDEPPGNS